MIERKREETEKITTMKKEVRRVRGKLSKKEKAKYGSTNHNFFDWIKKERVVVAEKETFESVEAEEMEIDDMDVDLQREERLQ